MSTHFSNNPNQHLGIYPHDVFEDTCAKSCNSGDDLLYLWHLLAISSQVHFKIQLAMVQAYNEDMYAKHLDKQIPSDTVATTLRDTWDLPGRYREPEAEPASMARRPNPRNSALINKAGSLQLRSLKSTAFNAISWHIAVSSMQFVRRCIVPSSQYTDERQKVTDSWEILIPYLVHPFQLQLPRRSLCV